MTYCAVFFRIFSVLSVLSAVTLLSACAVGPDFLRPAAPKTDRYTQEILPKQTVTLYNAKTAQTAGSAVQNFNNNQDIPADWWKIFGSEPLNKLIDRALQANPDLQAAQATLRQAQENMYAAYGSFSPEIDVKASPVRQKITGAGFGQPGAPSSLFTLYNASVNVSYGLDIFGGNRRTLESLSAQKDYQRFQLEAAYLTLTTNIVTAAIAEASLRAQIKETEAIIATSQRQLDILQKQFEFGGLSKVAVLTQQATLAQMQATLPPLQKELAQKRNQLAALAGNLPSDASTDSFTLDTLKLPENLPVSLPSQLVEQRPDIKAAEALLHTASAGIGVATANMLPQLTLNAGFGSQTTQFSNLFTPEAQIWSLSASLFQPLFHGGQLFHMRRASIANYDKAAAQYKSTVLSAFQNVADSLRALQFDALALDAEAKAAQASAASLELSRTQFQAGAISYLSMLDAERLYQQTRVNLVRAQGIRYADTAALFQALGGGWWNRDAMKNTKAVDNSNTAAPNKTAPNKNIECE
jgi:NodT family efflux transporter outer membrane factor (OMF) lipoprotein